MDHVAFVEILDGRGRVVDRQRIVALPATLGRSDACDVIVDDPFVCPTHLRLVRDDGGTLAIEDAGSVNGTYGTDGARLHRMQIDTETAVRVGETTIRLRPANAPVAPALVQRASAPVDWLRRARGPRLLATCGALIVLQWAVYFALDSYDRMKMMQAASAMAGMGALVALWASGWALVTRVLTQEWRFAGHLVIASAFLVVDRLLAVPQGYVAFLSTRPWPPLVFRAVTDVASVSVLLALHVAVLGRFNRRSGVIAVFAATFLIATQLTTSSWLPGGGDASPQFDATLRPFPQAWLPASTVTEFVAETAGLAAEVQDHSND